MNTLISLPPIIDHSYTMLTWLTHIGMCLFIIGYTSYSFIIKNNDYINKYTRLGFVFSCIFGMAAVGKLIYSSHFSSYGVLIYHGLVLVSLVMALWAAALFTFKQSINKVVVKMVVGALSLLFVIEFIVFTHQHDYILSETKAAIASADPKESLQHLANADKMTWVDVSPEFEKVIRLKYVQLYAQNGEYEKSLKKVSQLINDENCSFPALQVLAYDYFKLGKFPEALAAVNQALGYKGDSSDLLELKKEICAKEKVSSRVTKDLNSAVAIEPSKKREKELR